MKTQFKAAILLFLFPALLLANNNKPEAKQTKEYIGKVLNYYKKSGVVYVVIESNNLCSGDVIQIHGLCPHCRRWIYYRHGPSLNRAVSYQLS